MIGTVSLPNIQGGEQVTVNPASGFTQVVHPEQRPLGSGPYVRALARLQVLKGYQNGWNGPRSLCADRGSFRLAERFLELLSGSTRTFSIEPTIFSEGTAVLELRSGGLKATLEFTADGLIAANIDDEDGEHDLDIEGFNGESIPAELAAYI